MSDNVLVLSAGRRVSLVRAFQQAVQELNLDSSVMAADIDPDKAAACHVADRSIKLPSCLAKEYIEILLEECLEHNIALVVPTIDTELKVLAESKKAFLEQGVTLVVSDYELVKKCRDKRLTNQLFADIGFATPTCYSLENIKFPCFSKPISGSMSQDIRILENEEELDSWKIDKDEMMFMEVISQDIFDEYTIDIYFNKASVAKCIVPRQRLEVRGGEVSKALTNKALVPLIKPAMENITGAFGCLTLQVFKHKTLDSIYGIEINPRFGGGFPLTDLAGARYPQWLIEEVILNKEREYFDGWQDQLMMLRYDGEVIVDCSGS